MAENVKYPQDEEKNEYRYIDFAWLDEIAMGLTAGAKKHPGETWREIPAVSILPRLRCFNRCERIISRIRTTKSA